MNTSWPHVRFAEFLRPSVRPFLLGSEQDANLVGMRLYGQGPFHRELKSAMKIVKKSHFIIRSGDVIYNKLFAWKGTFGIVPAELDGMFVSDKFPTYELNRKKVHEDFLRWYFRDPRLWEQARAMSTGSAALSKLTLNPPKFLLLTMPMPPLDIQREVARRLERLSVEINQMKKIREAGSKEASALMGSALRRLSESFPITGRLQDVLSSLPRNGWSAKCDNAEDGIPVLSLSAVTGFRYRADEFKRTSLYATPDGHFWLRPGDLLITRSNSPELVGHAAIYSGEPQPCIYPDLMMRLKIDHRRADGRFVWYWLQSPIVRSFITQSAKGTSPTMRKISQGIVANIPFPSAFSINDQRQVVAWLDRLQLEVDTLKGLQIDADHAIDALLPAIVDKAFQGAP